MRQVYRHKWQSNTLQKSISNQSNCIGNGSGGYGILWEIEKVDRRIQIVKSEIFVLKQQLKIIKSYYAPTSSGTNADPSKYSPRYLVFEWLNKKKMVF